jgi:hypothetical protein
MFGTAEIYYYKSLRNHGQVAGLLLPVPIYPHWNRTAKVVINPNDPKKINLIHLSITASVIVEWYCFALLIS